MTRVFLDDEEPTVYQPYVDDQAIANESVAVEDAIDSGDMSFREDALYYLKSRCLKDDAPTAEIPNDKLLAAVEYAAWKVYYDA